MRVRIAKIEDIPTLQEIRNSVRENILSNPNIISQEDYKEYLTTRGKGWVCEMGKRIVGFAVIDIEENNVWALFVMPNYEKKGIGKLLHTTMLKWYFNITQETIWLGTDPNTRAENFYRNIGWSAIGTHNKTEIKFEMTFDQWRKNNKEK